MVLEETTLSWNVGIFLPVYTAPHARRQNSVHHKHTHASWCVEGCLQRITSVPLAHVSQETWKVCGHNIPQLRMKSPANLEVSYVWCVTKVARPVLRFRNILVFVRNAWELYINRHFEIGGHDNVVHLSAFAQNTWKMKLAGRMAWKGKRKVHTGFCREKLKKYTTSRT